MRALTGTGRLVRLALRRDRILLPVWIAAISGLTAAVVSTYEATVGDAADRAATAAFAAANPMARLFDGPASGTDLPAMAMVEAYQVVAILTALMCAQAVVRHTRQDEETGRAELLGSGVIGRHARLTAALVVTLSATLVLGVAVAAVFTSAGFGGPGAWAAGMAVAGIGWAFAGIAAVTAQVFATARAANAAAGAALGAVFLLRAVGDLLGDVADNGVVVISAWPSWLSPIGWGQQVRPYYEDNWWIAGLFAGLLAVLVTVAFALENHRDVGPGMVGTRPGPARAPRSLRSGLGLAWRLQRTIWATWAFGILALTAAFASVGESAEDLLAENEQLADLLTRLSPGASVIELFIAFVMTFVGIAAGGYVVQALLRMRAEEVSGRLEPVLATSVARWRWLTGHVLIAYVGITVTFIAAGLVGGVVYGAMTGSWSQGISDMVAASAVQVPAVLALAGFVVAVFAMVPRWAGALSWGALAGALVMGQLGALLDLPQWVLNISPFTHVPQVPAEPFAAAPVLILLAVAAGLTALGYVVFGRRDLRTT